MNLNNIFNLDNVQLECTLYDVQSNYIYIYLQGKLQKNNTRHITFFSHCPKINKWIRTKNLPPPPKKREHCSLYSKPVEN